MTEFTNVYACLTNTLSILKVFVIKYCFSVICSFYKNLLMRFFHGFVNFTCANFDFLSREHDCKQDPPGEN